MYTYLCVSIYCVLQAKYQKEGIAESLLTITATAEDNAKGLDFFIENKVLCRKSPTIYMTCTCTHTHTHTHAQRSRTHVPL